MNNKQTLSGLLFTILCFINPLCQGQDTSSVNAYFIGSHGYLLESENSKVALDALIYWEGQNYGYIKPPLEVANQMSASASPFDSLDLILIGHAHEDHYNTEIVERAMLKNLNAVLVTTPDVINDISAHVDSFSFYSDRVWVPNLEFYQSVDTVINNIPLTITSIPHGGSSMELYVPAIELDSIRFVQLNGWNSLTAEAYDTLGFNKKRADVIFLCYSYLLDNAKNLLFREHLHPLFSTISHVDGATTGRLEIIQDSILSKQEEYPMNMLYIPMEQIRYRKINDTILVDTLNIAPIYTNEIEYQEIYLNSLYSFTIPEDFFSDPEGESVNISVTSSNGGALPGWLNFNPTDGTIEGTPTETGNLTIYINGIDPHYAIRSYPLRMLIVDPQSIEQGAKSIIKLFPNPTNGTVSIDFDGILASYAILNITGLTIQKGLVQNNGIIDLSSLASGLYYIHLTADEESINAPILIE
jgi:hypothetical protein